MWIIPILLSISVLSSTNVEIYDVPSDEKTSPRWLGDVLEDTDISLASLLSLPVDGERVMFALQFVLGYQGLLERLRDAARSRDPRTLQTFRQLKQRGKSLQHRVWKIVPTNLHGSVDKFKHKTERAWGRSVGQGTASEVPTLGAPQVPWQKRYRNWKKIC
ncbi:uncharacterized protein LOC129003284 [Macrosteles quadrilineatus]|uniref:uncharacterized protein LOC129003284 n=1 Tax=Macrosteles quadrilineatus TaxID=74068 RepID=UPI0023E2B42C|nr:uncharacterized protein LOC129003284 [Macrosteles quadrilineatus]